MFWREQGAGGEIVVWFTGVLDATSARDVRRFLEEATGRIALDFSQATEIDYYGLSVLASEIVRMHRPVVLRGLRANHVRILEYLGLDPNRLGSDSGTPSR